MRTIYRDIIGAFIFSSDGKLLLGRTGVYKNQWVVPGGGIDQGETKLEALRREMLEEVGIDINDGKLEEVKGVITGQSEKDLRDTDERVLVKMKFYNYTLTINRPADKIDVRMNDDLIDAQWFDPSKLERENVSTPTITTLQKLGYLK